MWEQNASTFEIDMNKLDDGDVEGFMIQGKQGYRDTMRNKIFIQNQYGFIWEPKPEAEKEDQKVDEDFKVKVE